MSTVDPNTIESASLSVTGQVRTNNQDTCAEFVSANGSKLMIVADGMGGHRGGATASRVAAETIGEVFASSTLDSSELLRSAFAEANRRVHEMSLEDGSLQGMGTTAVALLFDAEGLVWAAHVGDSRAYRLTNNGIEQITGDHSVVGEMVRRGLITPEEAKEHPRRNEILRSIGIDSAVDIDIARVAADGGDLFLLCSDGLTGMVSDSEIASLVNRESPGHAVQSLVDLANDRGGTDNITVQIASTSSAASAAAKETAPFESTAIAGDSRDADSPGASLSPLYAGIAAAVLFVAALYLVFGGGE